jgi:hypothetical protein
MQIGLSQTTQASGPFHNKLATASVRVQLSTTHVPVPAYNGGDYDPFDFLAINALTLFKEFSLAWMSFFALVTSIP